ncbi:MAG: 23S rRNA (adenine(2503)-C(2))-methyltransferase RlmN [Deltaproteobacteria bacterium]|nr:23S rRNA (adenine(2503)-C(2))-methyltransferase RlmN [Deltaproteobacteria bacterium]
MSLPNIKNLSLPALEEKILSWGVKSYVRDQILIWLYRERVTSFDEMTNLSKELRRRLAETFVIDRMEVERTLHSVDGSQKFLFKLADGQKIESVLMPQKNDRLTLCISSQVGCAIGCCFCKTAEMGLMRNLTQGEILGQVLEVQQTLPHKKRISNIVFMGMGEPFHNYETVISALKLLRDPRCFNFGKRKITVSTSGLAPEIEKFGKDADVKLALSLNATTDPSRTEIMPINKAFPMERLQKACRTYNDLTGLTITIEYVLFAGLNDSREDAKRLVRFLSPLNTKINVIPYNEYPGSPFKRPSDEKIRDFHHTLADHNFQVNIRYSKGLDIMGACGQLATA